MQKSQWDAADYYRCEAAISRSLPRAAGENDVIIARAV
jgi:hypothetical protein